MSVFGLRAERVPARYRRVLNLAVVILLTGTAWDGARTEAEPTRLLIAAAAGALIISAWLIHVWRPRPELMLLVGAGSVVLHFVLPSGAPIIGVFAGIFSAASRLDLRTSAIASTLLGIGFVIGDAVSAPSPSLANVGFTSIGLAAAYFGTLSIRRIRDEHDRAERLLEELRLSRDAQIERAALAERSRIAREIHDVLAHTLSALAVQLQATRLLLEQQPTAAPEAVSAVERAHRLARDGLDEARRAIGALRGDQLPGPDALTRLVEDFRSDSGIACTLSVDGTPQPMAPEARLALYRTAQEALTNVRKHAPSSTVEIRVRYAADSTELVVQDTSPNGTVASPTGAGYGLLGMRERAELAGGTLEAGHVAGGFRIRLWLPATP